MPRVALSKKRKSDDQGHASTKLVRLGNESEIRRVPAINSCRGFDLGIVEEAVDVSSPRIKTNGNEWKDRFQTFRTNMEELRTLMEDNENDVVMEEDPHVESREMEDATNVEDITERE